MCIEHPTHIHAAIWGEGQTGQYEWSALIQHKEKKKKKKDINI